LCALALVHKDAWLYAESLLALLHISTDRRSHSCFSTSPNNVTDARLWLRPALRSLIPRCGSPKPMACGGVAPGQSGWPWYRAPCCCRLRSGNVSRGDPAALCFVDRQPGNRPLHALRHPNQPRERRMAGAEGPATKQLRQTARTSQKLCRSRDRRPQQPPNYPDDQCHE